MEKRLAEKLRPYHEAYNQCWRRIEAELAKHKEYRYTKSSDYPKVDWDLDQRSNDFHLKTTVRKRFNKVYYDFPINTVYNNVEPNNRLELMNRFHHFVFRSINLLRIDQEVIDRMGLYPSYNQESYQAQMIREGL